MKWTEEEKQFLRDNVEMGWDWCAEQLGRSHDGVTKAAQKLGLKNGKNSYQGGRYICGSEYTDYQRSAKKRKHLFDITISDIEQILEIQEHKCKLSGIEIYFNKYENCGTTRGNASIDRIDSNIGYVSGNIQLLDKHVNMAKQRLSQDEFLDMCARIAKYNNL